MSEDTLDGPDKARRDETPAERMDRNGDELLQELRVTQTGVQILSGFLLTLPFQQRFVTLPGYFRVIFLVAVSFSTLATGLIVAPVSAHRLLFRKHEKDALVNSSARLAKAGLAILGLTVTTVALLIFGVVAGLTVGVVAAAVVLVLFTMLWVVGPSLLLRRERRS